MSSPSALPLLVPALALPSLISISDLSYGIDRQLSLLIPVHNPPQERAKLEGCMTPQSHSPI